MLLSWGDLAFEAADITSYSEDGGPQYVEHALISRKPKIQCTGDNLRSIKIGLDVHFLQPNTVTAGSPQGFVDKMYELASSHSPYPLTWGYGKFEGNFIAESLSLTREQTTADGRLMIASYALTLKEYVDNNQKSDAPAIKSNAMITPSTSKQFAVAPTKIAGTETPSATATTAQQVVRQG